MSKANILIVDDDPILRNSLKELLEIQGYNSEASESAVNALPLIKQNNYDIILSDLNMPGMDGLELLKKVKKAKPDVIYIIITGYGTIGTTVDAMKLGAYDYITKPINDEEFKILIERALHQKKLMDENVSLKKQLEHQHSFENIIGQDYKMSKIFETIKTVGDTKSTILLTGESGTGKTMIAEAIHHNSPRRDKPFVVVSCGALPETLLESELFGYERGAFTGADKRKEGKFKVAHEGTLFLDEISVAPVELQIKLLRVLDEMKFEALGSNKTEKVDVRVITATNYDLETKVKEGTFREDLFYRVNVVNIEIPPLRDRLGDIRLLANHFLGVFAGQNNKRITRISDETMDILMHYDWPGNVRELVHTIERAVILSRGEEVLPEVLPDKLRNLSPDNAPTITSDAQSGEYKDCMEQFEKQLIRNTLIAHNWHRDKAASVLGINRSTLFNKMRKYDLLEEG